MPMRQTWTALFRAQAALASLVVMPRAVKEDLVMALEKDWQIYEDAASGNTMAEQGF